MSQCQGDILRLKEYLNNRIIGQDQLIDKMLITLLSDGNMLVEGAPGLAKTKAIKELSNCIDSDFHRIQFTPDLLPADITGSDVYRIEKGAFEFVKGPIFHGLLLADEINRAPAKVQSALLEGMSEKQVTVGAKTYKLPELFMVMATQNPIEQEGTYPLPEAQLDRFLMYVKITYPPIEEERRILDLVRREAKKEPSPVFAKVSQEAIFNARNEILDLHLEPKLEEYIVQLVNATRDPDKYGDKLSKWINFGASPRGTISLDRCSKAKAWLEGRDFVIPEDIHSVLHDCLRHRIILSFEAEAEGVTPDSFIDVIANRVAVP